MAHDDGIGAASPKVCRRLEGADARLHGKILRIDDDARIESRRGETRKHKIFAEIHQKLRDKLARRAGRRLDVDEQRRLDETVARAPMMVDDNDLCDAF